MKCLPHGIVEPSHPDGRELTEFERRFLRLRLIGHEAHLLFCSITRTEDRKRDGELALSVQNYALIVVCRFLEVWGQFQSLGKDNRRVRDFASAASPYLDRINIWPGLREFRNWILAHRYQIEANPEFIPPWVVMATGRVPTKPAELLLLLDCVRQVSACACAYYGDIYRSLQPLLRPDGEPTPARGVSTGEEAESERIAMAVSMTERMARLGANMNDPVFAEFTCRPLEAVI